MKQFLLTENKEWLFLAFFPQEDEHERNQLRAKLTPFLKAVTKALSVELEYEKYLGRRMKSSITDDIIHNIPAENSTSNRVYSSALVADTLHFEFAGLLSLR